MPRNPPTRPVLDVYEAFRSTVHDYGVADMAAKMGMPVGTLYNKANINESSAHKPLLGEAVLVQVIADDTRIVESMAHTLGGVFMRLPDLKGVSDAALIEMLCEVQVQDGLFHGEIRTSLMDRKFTKEEFNRVQARARRFVTAVLEATRRIEGMVDE